MENLKKRILYNEQGLVPGTPYEKGQWKRIISHNEHEIKGFFGEYKFLSNFEPAKVSLEEDEYTCVENAFQAAKYEKDFRTFLKNCSPEDAIKFVRENPTWRYSKEEWDQIRLEVMRELLEQKFDPKLNQENYQRFLNTGEKYLEETNWWGDTFWGVHKTDASETGVGENNLGKLEMEIRKKLAEQKNG